MVCKLQGPCTKFERSVLGLHPAYEWDTLHQQSNYINIDNCQEMSEIDILGPMITKIYGWVGARAFSKPVGLDNLDPFALLAQGWQFHHDQTVARAWSDRGPSVECLNFSVECLNFGVVPIPPKNCEFWILLVSFGICLLLFNFCSDQ